MNLYRLDIRNTPDGLRVELTFDYEGRLPPAPQRKDAILRMLMNVHAEIEARGLDAIGEASQTAKAGSKAANLRRDIWQIGDRGEE